jgi:hypothetical protein
MISCGPKQAVPTEASAPLSETLTLAPVTPIADLQAVHCSSAQCRLHTATGVYLLTLPDLALSLTEEPPEPAPEVWPIQPAQSSLAEDWNVRAKNQWRSPFQATIPSPSGGLFKLHRSATPGTSRIARLGGQVMTARQGLDPGNPAYPWTLALHPTGAEAYHIVWPNPDLIAFNARTLETTWRIRLSGPATGLFVSADGRYLVAELEASAPEEQLLDYAPSPRLSPEGHEPFGDGAWTGIERPSAERTALVDLSLGQAVAEVPGRFVGFQPFADGAIIAGSGGVARVQWSED